MVSRGVTQDAIAGVRRLTPRQFDVLRDLVEGLTREAIARRRGVTPRVVAADVAAVYRAFDLERSELTSAQRRLALRRALERLRRWERHEAATAGQPARPSGLSPEPEAASTPTETVTLEPVAWPSVTPVTPVAPWRWWPLGLALVLLAVVGIWRLAPTAAPAAEVTETATLTGLRHSTTPPLAVVATTTTPVPTVTPPPAIATPQPATATVLPATPSADAGTPAVGPLELAGKVASGLPGTPLVPGTTVTSVLDRTTKPLDVYALSLHAGDDLTVVVEASASEFDVLFGSSGTLPAVERGDRLVCASEAHCSRHIPIAADGVYLLVFEAYGSGIRYRLQTARAPLVTPPGVRPMTGKVASTMPGTLLDLGAPVASVVDGRAKPVDVSALELRAGQTWQVEVSADSGDSMLLLLPPGSPPFTGAPDQSGGTVLCTSSPGCTKAVPIAATGTYALVVEGIGPAMRYTLRATAT